ncbi:hypothetical protein D0Z08_09790 [Nocardioides immobilis]|uniref:Uncharacterized protein n=1 Tax=Nocardioides immobilis TaxID=2049295 RepID=A0A417Y457_9ACTN|nr:hypothetical protein [Nocardioides immobilis]RHW27429.1 hypothetical protein D0Z08_09790 [Nocardioides immobilis]
MSIPTDELRARLARELDELGPGPDLVPEAASRGATSLRRRRAMGGAALAVAAVVGGAVATGVLAAGDEASPTDEDLKVADTTSAAPAWDPLADGHVTEQEWERAVAEALSAALPARYGEVRPIESDFDVQMFGTSGGSPQLQLDLGVSGWHRSEHPVRYQAHSCAAIDAARELHSCSDLEYGDGWFAVVETGLMPPGNAGPFEEGERITIPEHDPDNIPDDWSFGTELHVMNADVSARLGFSELGWDELSGNDLPGITDEEMLAVAQDPAFLELVRVGVQWWYDQPPPEPLEIDGEIVPTLTGKGQQVPPRFPS